MTETRVSGVLREQWDDVALVQRRWNEHGVLLDERPYNSDEIIEAAQRIKQRAASADDKSLHDQALTAYKNNRAYLELTSPTMNQALDQIKALTRQVNGILKAINKFTRV